MNRFIASAGAYFRQWFHKRSIIIVSEQKVKHVPISGGAQFFALVTLVGGVCWASYSTGSYMAARSVLKEQNQTLRSVASARVETNFNSLFPSTPLNPEAAAHSPGMASLSDPKFTLAALDNNRLFARIAFLEYKVAELKNTNEAIIERVHEKTSGRIDDLESIIRQTGLPMDDLKKQVSNDKTHHATHDNADGKSEGGPYIPAGPVNISSRESELFNSLDKLETLRQIVGILPLGMPISNAEEQSPFGHRIDPINGHLAFHSGLDLAGPTGSKIHAPLGGKVVAAGWNGSYGNCVDIDHGYGIVTRYGHLSQILVKEGQTVSKDQLIGIQGSTGRSTGPHLHYEVRYHDQPMNPKNFITAGRYVSEE